jgi:hypothetical protein
MFAPDHETPWEGATMPDGVKRIPISSEERGQSSISYRTLAPIYPRVSAIAFLSAA